MNSAPTYTQEIDRLADVKRRVYDDEASSYDDKRFRTPAGRFYEQLANRQIYELLGEARNGAVLDVATGTGRIALGLAARGVTVTGVDISDRMLEAAREKAARARLTFASFQRGNAISLPFDDQAFDAVLSFRFLHIMEPRHQIPFIGEMVRVLKPGGTLLLELNNALPHLFANVFRRDPNVSIWPWQIRRHIRLGAPVDVVEVAGIGLPGLSRMSRYNSALSRAIALTLQRGPTAYLGRQIAIKAIKAQPA
jgi:SAM-dependent methyltransferase